MEQPALCHGVVTLRQTGQKQRSIARFYHISQGTVSKILKRNDMTGVPTHMPRPGRPIKTTRRQDHLLARFCTDGRAQPTSSLRKQWQNDGVRVSRTLVNGRLIRAGYRARRPLKETPAIGGPRGGGGGSGVRIPPFSKITGIDFYSGFRRNAQHRLFIVAQRKKGGGGCNSKSLNQSSIDFDSGFRKTSQGGCNSNS